jgi:hypothetical protein
VYQTIGICVANLRIQVAIRKKNRREKVRVGEKRNTWEEDKDPPFYDAKAIISTKKVNSDYMILKQLRNIYSLTGKEINLRCRY